MAINTKNHKQKTKSIRHRPGAQAKLKAEVYLAMAEKVLAVSSDAQEVTLAELIISDVGKFFRKEMSEEAFMNLTHNIQSFQFQQESDMSKNQQAAKAAAEQQAAFEANQEQAMSNDQLKEDVKDVVEEVKETVEHVAGAADEAAREGFKDAQTTAREAFEQVNKASKKILGDAKEKAQEEKGFFETLKDNTCKAADAVWNGETFGVSNKYLIGGAVAAGAAYAAYAYFSDNNAEGI